MAIITTETLKPCATRNQYDRTELIMLFWVIFDTLQVFRMAQILNGLVLWRLYYFIDMTVIVVSRISTRLLESANCVIIDRINAINKWHARTHTLNT